MYKIDDKSRESFLLSIDPSSPVVVMTPVDGAIDSKLHPLQLEVSCTQCICHGMQQVLLLHCSFCRVSATVKHIILIRLGLSPQGYELQTRLAELHKRRLPQLRVLGPRPSAALQRRALTAVGGFFKETVFSSTSSVYPDIM